MTKRTAAGFFLFMTMALTLPAEPLEVKLGIRSVHDGEKTFPEHLLIFLLDSSGIDYTISYSDKPMTTPRMINRLVKNEDMNLMWMGTSAENESRLLPVRYPVYRGLLGYRLFFINKADQPQFSRIRSLRDLQRYTGAQGIGWSDVPLLESAGLRQEEIAYDNIFRMLNHGGRSISYFSRGVTEIFHEYETRHEPFPNLVIEENLLLVYPFAMFFFTNEENRELARVLSDAFEKTTTDGSLQDFFNNHPLIKPFFEKARIDERTRIDIDNPFLTNETKTIPEIYWQ